MNAYEEKLEVRRQRLLDRASKARNESNRRAQSSIDRLPSCGSPILIGHHSENRHRRAIEKSDNDMRMAVDADKKADRLEQRAASVGKGGISSDDPEAVAKLEKKLARLQEMQDLMKAGNKAYKKGGNDALREAVGDKLADAAIGLMAKSWYGNKPFPSYELTNNSANVRRIEKRIEDLKVAASTESSEDIEGEGYTIRENTDINRIQIIFDGKPNEDVRATLKANGFRWSRYEMAWQRQLNNAGRYAAKVATRDL